MDNENLTELLTELTNNIDKYDELLDMWFSDIPASIAAAGGDDVYDQADHLRNRSKEIIDKISKYIKGDIVDAN